MGLVSVTVTSIISVFFNSAISKPPSLDTESRSSLLDSGEVEHKNADSKEILLDLCLENILFFLPAIPDLLMRFDELSPLEII